jgi:flagellar biosynthesis/type III secretory pathway protein FliH
LSLQVLKLRVREMREERRKEGKKEGRKEGRKKGRKGGRVGGRNIYIILMAILESTLLTLHELLDLGLYLYFK